MKKIKITFLKENIWAVAILLEDKAPQTCKLLWDTVETPLGKLCNPCNVYRQRIVLSNFILEVG